MVLDEIGRGLSQLGVDVNGAWRQAAHARGLGCQGYNIFGELQGIGVKVTQEVVEAYNVPFVTWTVAHLPLALDLGLSLKSHGAVAAQPSRPADPRLDISTGDAGIDQGFALHADEASRAQALIDESFCTVLREHVNPQTDVEISDNGVRIAQMGVATQVAPLLWSIDATVALARALDAGRKRVRVAKPLRKHNRALKAYAKEKQLKRSRTPLCVWGQIEDLSIDARAVRSGPASHHFEVSVRPPEPFPAPADDETFAQLREHWQVRQDPQGLHARGPASLPKAAVPELVDGLVDIASAMRDGSERRGPYR